MAPRSQESAHGPPPAGAWARYAFATMVVAFAICTRLLLDPVLGDQLPYGSLLFAVVVVAWGGGLGPALLAVFLGVAAAAYYLLPPRQSFLLHGQAERVGIALYGIVSLGIALLGGAMRRAREHAEEAAHAARNAASEAEREVRRRAEAEAALREANVRLEERVRARTGELAAANESLRASEAVVAGIVSSAMDGIVTVDERRRITRLNSAAEAMFRYSADELLQKPLDTLIPERFRVAHNRHIGAFADTGVTRRRMGELGLVTGLRSDGTEFPIEASISQMEVGGRRLFTAIVRDITERRRVEEELHTSRSQLVTALDAGGMATWQVDFEADEVGWDDANRKLWGRTREEIVDTRVETMIAFVHPEDREAVGRIARSGAHAGNTVRIEYRVLLPDGAVAWHASSGQLERDAEGRPVRYTGVLTDVSERKRAEVAQLRSQKLEALGTLAGGIAHDFNNILLAITGNARLAAADLPGDHPVQRSLGEISKAGVRAADVVRRILTFSRPQDRRREIMQLRPAVEEALGLLRATLPAMIELRAELEAEVPPIAADATQVHQIVINLATNAAHALGGGGWIEFRLATADFGAEVASVAPDLRPGRYVCLSVRDNGCGMDGATLARIFDPFFTTKAAGTGLGLSVVHGIMKSVDGATAVDSRPGGGTTFRLYFPAVAEEQAQAATRQRETGRGHGERVLYVDDEDALVFLTTRVLTRLGYEVTGFSDPRAALEAFRSRPADFDVLVTDLSMPHLQGFQLAAEVLAVRPDVPVVVTSGYVQEQDQQTAARLGVHALILKPDTVDELGRVLDGILRDRRLQQRQEDAKAGARRSNEPEGAG